MNRLKQLWIKEFLQIKRDKKFRFMMFFAPVFMLLIMGYAATTDVKNVELAVYDADHSRESRELVERFIATGYFRVVAYPSNDQEVIACLDETRARIVLVFPEDFSRRLGRGQTTRLQMLADGADANTAAIAMGYAGQIIAGYSAAILQERMLRTGGRFVAPKVTPVVRVWFNPDLRSANFMVPAVVALILMLLTTTFTAVSIVKEKEIGTLEQILVTPIRAYEFILGKLMPFVAIGFIDVVLTLLVAIYWFDIPLKGSVPLLFGLSGLFVLTTLGLGLFVSTISSTQQQAMMTAQFFIFFPFIFLSGFTFPIDNMPVVVQWISIIIPLRYFLEIIRGIFLKGVGFSVLWPQAAALLIFGVVILSLSVARFRKRLT